MEQAGTGKKVKKLTSDPKELYDVTFPSVIQSPSPGTSHVMFCGDCLLFTLTLNTQLLPGTPGSAPIWVPPGLPEKKSLTGWKKMRSSWMKAWYDIQMIREKKTGSLRFCCHCTRPGIFRPNVFLFLKTRRVPVWPEGDNCILNVEPAGTCCANIIYNAFVRQFGPSRSSAGFRRGSCLCLP
jgi:starch synthase (maltosyl-transferring)